MSARAPRRRFATPFVVTLAAIPACTTAPPPEPIHANPPPPPQPQPQPAPDPATTEAPPPAATAEPTPAPPVVANPPRPTAGPTEGAPPEPTAPAPSKFERRWTVTKVTGKDRCQAFSDSSCPKVLPGQPIPPCNPPPPIAYACPPNMNEGDVLHVVLRAGATECFVDPGPIHCPAKATCNPPPPRKVPCPAR